jgi:aryl-alcohol dehydrogenase-like predicted oxidoreductase
MEGGLLAGRPLDARQVGRDPGDIRARIVAAAPAVARLAQDLGGTPAQLLIAFAMSHPAAFTTLFGTSRPAQFRENLGAVDLLHRVGADTIREAVAPLWIDRGIVSPEGP